MSGAFPGQAGRRYLRCAPVPREQSKAGEGACGEGRGVSRWKWGPDHLCPLWYMVRDLSFSGRSCDVESWLLNWHLKGNLIWRSVSVRLACLWGIFLFVKKVPVHCGWRYPWAGEPGLYKKFGWPWAWDIGSWQYSSMVPALLLMVCLSQQREHKLGLKTICGFLRQTETWEEIWLECQGLGKLKIKLKVSTGKKIVFEEDLRKDRSPRKTWPCPDCHRLAGPQGLGDHSTWPLLARE